MEKSGTRNLIKNSSALFAIQLANYLIPILLVPFLTRTLGIEEYGIIAFGLAICQISAIVTDFGFNLSATFQIANDSSDRRKISKIIGSVYACKIGLLLICCSVISGLILIQTKYQGIDSFFWCLLIPIAAQAFQNNWLFQGIEKMATITIYTVISRVVFVVLVISTVSDQSDIHWVAISLGIGNAIATGLSIILMVRMGYRPSWPSLSSAIDTLKFSSGFFWSRAAVATYTAGGALFLGATSSPLQVAIYSVAEQLYKGLQSVITPMSQALYPYMARTKNRRLFIKILGASMLASIIALALGSIFGQSVISLVFGRGFEAAYLPLNIFLLTFCITTPSILLGYPFLGAYGQNNLANRSVLIASALQITLLAIIWRTGSSSAATVCCSILSTELAVLILRGYWAQKISG